MKIKGLSHIIVNKTAIMLKDLYNKHHLQMCGPFTDKKGAVLIIRASSKEEAEKLIQNDPFVKQAIIKNT